VTTIKFTSSALTPPHPTRQKLIETTVALLDELRPNEITVDMILQQSGISKGSLYHHFEDVEELFEAAEIARFIVSVDQAVFKLQAAIEIATTPEELAETIRASTRSTQRAILSPVRLERARTLGRTLGNERFLKALGREQQRATYAIADIIEIAKSKGLIKENVNPQVFAVFIQAYSLGRVVDDITYDPISEEDWNQMINELVINYLIKF
jgi:AcrR family transcriptional regulator